MHSAVRCVHRTLDFLIRQHFEREKRSFSPLHIALAERVKLRMRSVGPYFQCVWSQGNNYPTAWQAAPYATAPEGWMFRQREATVRWALPTHQTLYQVLRTITLKELCPHLKNVQTARFINVPRSNGGALEIQPRLVCFQIMCFLKIIASCSVL